MRSLKALTNREFVFVAIGLILFLVTPLVARYCGWDIGNSVLWLTGVVVLIYTNETYRLRLQMVRQNDISVKPFVVAYLRGKRWERHLVIKNIGRGTALFVEVEDVVLGEVVGDLEVYRDRITDNVATFGRYNFIEAGEEETFLEALCDTHTTGRSRYIDFTPSLDPDTAKQNYELRINYQDVDGRNYQTKMRIGKDGTALISPNGFAFSNDKRSENVELHEVSS